jgi:hypothetical protein
MTGRAGLELFVKPPFGSVDHCIAVRVQFRSGSRKIVTHSNFVAVADDGSSGERHHQAVDEFQTPAISLQYGSEPSSNPALIQLHVLVGTECREDGCALLLVETPEVQLIVVAKELSPLCRRGRGFVSLIALASGLGSLLARAKKRC